MPAPPPRASIALLAFVAWRGLAQSPVVASLLVAAVAGGVAFQIPNAANIAGYRAEILERGVAAGLGDVRVLPRSGQAFDDADARAARIARVPGVVAAVPVLMLPGAVRGAGAYRTAPVIGVDPAAPRLPFSIVKGASLRRGDDRGVVLGSTLAEVAHARPGDPVQLRVILGAQPALAGDDNVGRYTMTVRGLAAGSFVAPETAIVDRGFLAAETGAPSSASLIVVYAADHFAAQALAHRLAESFPDVDARAWMDDSPFLGAAIRSASAVAALSAAMVVIAVVIPVWALLYVHVHGRRRQIGLLGAIGFSAGDLFAAYLLQSLIVGAAGVAGGCALGFGLVRWFQAYPIFHEVDFVIRPVMAPATFVGPSLLVFAATVGAGVLPAWRASRLRPAELLRGSE